VTKVLERLFWWPTCLRTFVWWLTCCDERLSGRRLFSGQSVVAKVLERLFWWSTCLRTFDLWPTSLRTSVLVANVFWRS